MKRLALYILLILMFYGCAIGLYPHDAHATPAQDTSYISSNGITTCQRKPATTTWACWGDNTYGQIGDGTTINRPTPVVVHTGFVQMSVGRFHSCARDTLGRVLCWGRNDSGQVGDGTTTRRLSPVIVRGGNNSHVSVGGYHTCSSGDTGYIECWGNGGSGQLGRGAFRGNSLTPLPTHYGVAMYKLHSGWAHVCAIEDISRKLMCWGHNAYGQLGNGNFTDQGLAGSPKNYAGVAQFTDQVSDVTGGWYNTCAIRLGVATCWGANAFGQLGNNTAYPYPQAYVSGQVALTGEAIDIKMSGESVCARARNPWWGNWPTLQCWGRNQKFQIGPGLDQFYPEDFTGSPGNTNATETGFLTSGGAGYAVGHEHTCSIWSTPSGFTNAYCAGGNDYGQRGAGPVAKTNVALRVVLP